MRKFSMTSLVAFMFRMLQGVGGPRRRSSLGPQEDRGESAEEVKALDLDELIERLEVLLRWPDHTRSEKAESEGELAGATLGLSMYAHML